MSDDELVPYNLTPEYPRHLVRVPPGWKIRNLLPRPGEPEIAKWLRRQIGHRLYLAQKACYGTDGHWWRRKTAMYVGGAPEPVGPLYAGEASFDQDGENMGGQDIVVYDEGAQSDIQFDHITANDPRDTIARCDAELEVLDLYVQTLAIKQGLEDRMARGEQLDELRSRDYLDAGRELAVLDTVVRLLASGYRHCDGYEAEWRAEWPA